MVAAVAKVFRPADEAPRNKICKKRTWVVAAGIYISPSWRPPLVVVVVVAVLVVVYDGIPVFFFRLERPTEKSLERERERWMMNLHISGRVI